MSIFLNGVYKVCKTTVTASERALIGCVVSKNISAPGWTRSLTRRRSFVAGRLGGFGCGRSVLVSPILCLEGLRGIGEGFGEEMSGIGEGEGSAVMVDMARGGGRGFCD